MPEKNRYQELMEATEVSLYTLRNCCSEVMLGSILKAGQKIPPQKTCEQQETWIFTKESPNEENPDEKNRATELIVTGQNETWTLSFVCPQHGALKFRHHAARSFKTFSLVCSGTAFLQLQTLKNEIPFIQAASAEEQIEAEESCLNENETPWAEIWIPLFREDLRMRIPHDTKYILRSNISVLILDYSEGMLRASFIDERTCNQIFAPMERIHQETNALIDQATEHFENIINQAKHQRDQELENLRETAQERHVTMRRNADLQELFPEEELEED